MQQLEEFTASIQDGHCQALFALCKLSEPYLVPPADEPGPGAGLTEQVHEGRPALRRRPTPLQNPSSSCTKIQLCPCPPLQGAVAGGAGQPVAPWYRRGAGGWHWLNGLYHTHVEGDRGFGPMAQAGCAVVEWSRGTAGAPVA